MSSRAAIREFYDRFGSRQDRQGWYEDRALARLCALGSFELAQTVVEIGPGTGRFAAACILPRQPAVGRYVGVELSPVMAGLCHDRLRAAGHRHAVVLTGGDDLPIASGSVDRLVAAYVLDLMSAAQLESLFAEAARVLRPDGWLCSVSLTYGSGPLTLLVSGLWQLVHWINPLIVGGCRPIRLADHLDLARWEITAHERVQQWGISSEVSVAVQRGAGRALAGLQ